MIARRIYTREMRHGVACAFALTYFFALLPVEVVAIPVVYSATINKTSSKSTGLGGTCTWGNGELITTFPYFSVPSGKVLQSVRQRLLLGVWNATHVSFTTTGPGSGDVISDFNWWGPSLTPGQTKSWLLLVQLKNSLGQTVTKNISWTLTCSLAQDAPILPSPPPYYLPPSESVTASGQDTEVPVEFGLLNADDVPHEYALSLSLACVDSTCTGPGPLAGDPCVNNSQCTGSGTCVGTCDLEGWLVDPLDPPSPVTLGPGVFRTLKTIVTVPGKSLVGEERTLTLTATQINPAAPGVTATSKISVDTFGAYCVPPDACVELAGPEGKTTGGLYHGDGSRCEVVFADEQCIPTVSEWGLVVMAVLVLTAATVVIMRRRAMVHGGS